MRSFRLGIVGALLAALLAGCEGTGGTETTMPTTAPVMPAEADQVKKEMQQRFHIGTTAKRALSNAKKH
jgi:hypothetical protein